MAAPSFADRPPPGAGHASVPALLALGIALAACAWLGRMAATSRWVLDADEAVHAVEGLRLLDRLEHGELGRFLVDSYLPERWQPPVQDHVRWYGIVHAWSLLPGFALLGPTDAAVRLPSVAYLLGSCLLVFALARRLSPWARDWSGLIAVALLLSAPNLITFTPQALTETCSLFWCLAGLLGYVRFVEQPGQASRAFLAGALLAVSVLAKYDHGLLLVACLGVAELLRQRGHPLRLLGSPARWVFLVPAVVLVLWLAHPDKLQAFRDTLGHPAYGTWRVIAANAAGSWLFEYSSSLGALLLIAGATAVGWSWSRQDPRLRAVWLYALLASALLLSRARFQFRYNLIEVPAFFVLAGALTPELLRRLSLALAAARRGALGRLSVLSAALGAVALAPLGLVQVRPGALREALAAALGALGPQRLGLSRGAADYAADLEQVLARALVLLGVGVLTLGLALLTTALWLALSTRGRTAAPRHLRALAAALALATLPGAAAFWGRAEGMLRWEWEGTPQLHEVIEEIAGATPVPGRLLLGGGWDQLTNNTLRWHLSTAYLRPRPRYDELEVVGDMVGSLVLPEPPRIAWWARTLREAPRAELPERVVLLDWRDDFLYTEDVGPEVEIYRATLAQRPAYELALRRGFDALGLDLEVWTRRQDEVPALLEPSGPAALEPGPTGRRRPGRWTLRDPSWRHLACPWLR